ncbi:MULTISPECIES: hypothetical protein [unclassified Microcoleus]|uniref:hypothetical protein n=1 Tax=unclassified Microcoleus TaxID=2642155 RepID=UPI002FCE79A6
MQSDRADFWAQTVHLYILHQVIRAIELNGMKKIEVAQELGLRRNTIDATSRWYCITGDFQAEGLVETAW